MPDEELEPRAKRIEAEFPPGATMPEELRRLCDYLDATGYPISGYMRLRPEGSTLQDYFGEGSDAWKDLAGFGAGPDGSILALWLNDSTRDTRVAPVVHLGSEGDALKVLAKDFRSFLELFAIGYNEIGFDDLAEPPKEPESAGALRIWLEQEFGIIPPTVGAGIVEAANQVHPGFASWVDQMSR